MPINTKKRREGIAAFNIVYGVLLSFVSVLLISFVTAWLISSEKLPENAMELVTKAAAFAAGVVGGLFAATRNRDNALSSALITVCVTAILRLAVSASSNEGDIFSAYSLWITALILAGGIAAAVACTGKRRRRRR